MNEMRRMRVGMELIMEWVKENCEEQNQKLKINCFECGFFFRLFFWPF